MEHNIGAKIMIKLHSLNTQRLWDTLGIFASAGCIVHCLLLPFAFTVLPGLTLINPENETVHIILACSALILSAIALFKGYRHHHSYIPASIGIPGLAMIWGAFFVGEPHWLESAIVSAGALFVATAHFYNHRIECH
jgi:hypothetical protein